VVDWLEGYREAMAKAGLPTNERLLNEPRVTPALLNAYREWLRAKPRPEAIITYAGVLEPFTEFVLPEMGLQPNRDVLLATFTDSPPEPCATITAAARVDWRAIGRTAVEMLQQKIAHPRTKQSSRARSIEVFVGI
jgi:DNA-binding LacI/PurR family transcriptional regulator